MSNNQSQMQESISENDEWSPESRQQWVSLAIAAATASLRATAPGTEKTKRVELKPNSI